MSKKLDFEKISVHDGPQQSPGFLLWNVSTTWRSTIEAVLKTLGLTHPQFVVLATTGWLTRDGEFASQAAVGKMVGLDPNTISQIMTSLEKKELIKRIAATDDGRTKNPQLTLQGKKLVEQAIPAVEQADREFFNTISSSELKQLVHIFQKIVV